jgi:hypothetical protein
MRPIGIFEHLCYPCVTRWIDHMRLPARRSSEFSGMTAGEHTISYLVLRSVYGWVGDSRATETGGSISTRTCPPSPQGVRKH